MNLIDRFISHYECYMRTLLRTAFLFETAPFRQQRRPFYASAIVISPYALELSIIAIFIKA